MGDKLKARLKQGSFDGPVHEAILNLLVSSAALRNRLEAVLAERGVSATQYNVLRILRGRYPAGYARCDIIERMIDRAPDVTRLIDRLVNLGFVERITSTDDKRLSVARITPKGLNLLEDADPALGSVYEEIRQRLTEEEFEQLSTICEKLYDVKS